MAASGALTMRLRDVRGVAIDDVVQVTLTPVSDSQGGQRLRTPEFAYKGAPACRVTSIACLDVGTFYSVMVDGKRHKTVAFIQRMTPSEVVVPDDLVFLLDPSAVKDLRADSYSELADSLTQVLEKSEIPAMQDPSAPGTFLQGERLYNAFDNLTKACLLNVWCKASDSSSDNVWQYVRGLRRIQQDRVFATLDPNAFGRFKETQTKYTRVSNALHEPMPGFERLDSFKTKDDHANLQVTFMRRGEEIAADIDIDESAGAEHTAEVIRNAFRGKTNPYLIRDLLYMNNKLTPPYELLL